MDFKKDAEAVRQLCKKAESGRKNIRNTFFGASVKLVVRESDRTYLSDTVYKIDEIYIDEMIIDIIIDGKHFNQNEISIIE